MQGFINCRFVSLELVMPRMNGVIDPPLQVHSLSFANDKSDYKPAKSITIIITIIIIIIIIIIIVHRYSRHGRCDIALNMFERYGRPVFFEGTCHELIVQSLAQICITLFHPLSYRLSRIGTKAMAIYQQYSNHGWSSLSGCCWWRYCWLSFVKSTNMINTPRFLIDIPVLHTLTLTMQGER